MAVRWVGLSTLVGRRGALGEARPTALVKMPALSADTRATDPQSPFYGRSLGTIRILPHPLRSRIS